MEDKLADAPGLLYHVHFANNSIEKSTGKAVAIKVRYLNIALAVLSQDAEKRPDRRSSTWRMQKTRSTISSRRLRSFRN